MKRYRIGEFAKQMGVSLDFIKYYEQAGLIQSTKDPKNHYHYFDFSQSKIVYLIQYYRSLGYSAQEIVKLLYHVNASDAIALFTEKAQMHKEHIHKSTHIVKQLEFAERALQYEPNGTWYIIRHPAVYFLPHTNGEDYIHDSETVRILRQWNHALPFVYSVDRCVLSTGDQAHMIQHGRAIAQKDAELISIPLDAPVQYLPEVRCLEYYLDVEHLGAFGLSPTLTSEAFRPALQVIEDKKLCIAGDMFIRFLSFYFKDGKQYEKNVLYIPVE